MRVFFATDIHGSETCWRKFLNSGPHYGADVSILGGDMTGKALVPVVRDGGDRWHGTLQEQRHDLTGEDEVAVFEQNVIRRGYYPFRTTPDELAELENDEQRLDDLFHREMLGTVERWMGMAEQKLAGQRMKLFVCPGNDDQFEVDEILRAAPAVELAEGRVVDVGEYQMASTGWANITPWHTYREEPEDVLLERIRSVVSQVTTPPERTILNLHCPPYGSGLDEAPGVNEDLTPKLGGHAPEPVGSTAVRTVIEETRPVLSLHGHIHESRGHSRIGPTLCINPGSSYEQGDLLGALIELDGKKVKNFVLTSG
ncbi:MAG: metallophosphoesterase family protein [Gaiellales bacterium]